MHHSGVQQGSMSMVQLSVSLQHLNPDKLLPQDVGTFYAHSFFVRAFALILQPRWSTTPLSTAEQ